MSKLRDVSVFWVILTALAITAAVPVILIGLLEVRTTQDEFEREARTKFETQARTQALLYDEELEQFAFNAALVATQAHKLLTRSPGHGISQEEVDQRLQKYGIGEPDDRFGLDAWFQEVYAVEVGDNRVSNVFLATGVELTPEVAYTVAATEGLNSLFDSIDESLAQTSAIGDYRAIVVTTNGVIRWYPFAPSDFFYAFPSLEMELMNVSNTIPGENLEISWSPPRIDFSQDGHVFVLNAIPLYEGDTFIGAVLHDFNLETFSAEVAELDIGHEDGVSFVIDQEGTVVIHPNYRPNQAWQQLSAEEQAEVLSDASGLEEWMSSTQVKATDYYAGLEPVVGDILASEGGLVDMETDGRDWVVAYHRLEETGWILLMMQPRAELIETAAEVSERVQTGAVVLIVMGLIASVIAARFITHPVLHLADAAERIEASVDKDTAEAIGQNLDQLASVGRLREINNLASVFEQMVLALQQRMVELDSIYTMGQTITASVDYDETMQAILASVRQVANFDAAEITVRRSQTLVVEAWSGQVGWADTKGHKYRVGKGHIGVAADKREVLFWPDVPADSDFEMETDHHEVRSLLVIPLVVGDQLAGTLNMVHHEANFFTGDSKRKITKLSAQAAIAIDNAVKVKEREAELKQQIAELKIEIDEGKRQAQVEEITDSDFFQNLQASAAQMRKRSAARSRQVSEAETTEPDASSDSDIEE